MKTYFALFLISATASLSLTPLLRRFCERYHLVDEPLDHRRVHLRAVPRLGGVAIFLSLLIALSVLLPLHNLLTQTALRPERRGIIVFLVCGFLVLVLGVYDDLRGTNARVKFAGLAGVAALFYLLGGRIVTLSIPFVGGVTLHPIVGFVLTVIWVVGVTNAFNLIDGVDGLASGSALFSSLVLLGVALIQGRPAVAVIALALTGALAGFLRYNFNPASIFLGDSGSLFVGFSLAALSLQGSQKSSTAVAVAIPILAFGLPVVDTGVSIARRLVSGKPIFQGDREHIHHMLLERGWSQRRVVLVLYGVSAVFGLLAMLFVNSGNGVTAVVLFVVGVTVVLGLANLRYHEVDEVKASVKRNIGERRVRLANNLRMRRACRAISSASTPDELFDGILEVLELGSFAYATALLSCNGDLDVNQTAVALAARDSSKGFAVINEGRICWSWKRSDFKHIDIAGSDLFWAMRLPLAGKQGSFGYLNLSRQLNAGALLFDVNYLTTAFQPAVAQAAERIFITARESTPLRVAAAGQSARY
ncbi:MAG: UDP-GlcNAc:undecaprenyl-phosphate/decaprenyl-phosphate GlcNAc-phosphate transferase [Blastocatellia bacterium]|jgi:UDP-GlcNAc:undecaprenyl-phosphate GlcNAc-1-phosphate transferase|nr:UDP-GlcNAc:undecaprenyl-phosphate/decaprenyl-phosphate GlcNAc-phosphate transferase [Blastocatellia bacterium]